MLLSNFAILAMAALFARASVLLSTRDQVCNDPEAVPLQKCVECTPCPIPEDHLFYVLDKNTTQGKTQLYTDPNFPDLFTVTLNPTGPMNTEAILEISKTANASYRVFGIEGIWGGDRKKAGPYINWFWLTKDIKSKRARCALTLDFPIDMFKRATVREFGRLEHQCP